MKSRKAPFPPDPRLAGRTLEDGKRLIRQGQQLASDRRVLWLRQGGRCFYCDRPMRVVRPRRGPWPPDMLTVDHILTRADGGRRGPKVAACYGCNHARGTTPAHEFILVVARRQGIPGGPR